MELKKKYNILVESLKLVASSSETQIKSLPNFVQIPDEIALIYNDAFLLIPQLQKVNFLSDTVVILLSKLNQIFDKMSTDKFIWEITSLKSSDSWEETRRLANEILMELKELYTIPNLEFIDWIN